MAWWLVPFFTLTLPGGRRRTSARRRYNSAHADSLGPHGEEPQSWVYPDFAVSCAASRTMGPPHPSRRALRDACVSGKRICLRPPQDEAIACPSDSFPARNAFSPSEPSTSSVGRKKSLRCLPVSAHRAGFVEDWAAWVEGSGGCHCSDTLGRYHADKITHVIWRHAVGNVGPSVRSPILKCWQCGPAPQWLACGSSGSSLQTAAIT